MTIPVRERINYWAGVTGRPLTSFEQVKVARPFRYNAKTQELTRVLKPVMFGPIYGYVELDLKLKQGSEKFDFDLLIHSQKPDFSDKFLTDLPAADRQMMAGLHGYEVVQWLMYGDVWSQIDHNRLHYLNGRTIGVRRVRLAEVLQPSEYAEQLMN